jgi:hypothetical protein
MGLAFVIFFPLGGIIIRFLASYLPVPVRLHYLVQIFSFALVLAGTGLGIWLSQGFQFSTTRTTPPQKLVFSFSFLRNCANFV